MSCSEYQDSIAHIGPQSEYNLRGACPTESELDEMCSQMAEMERKFQEEFRAWESNWRASLNLPQVEQKL